MKTRWPLAALLLLVGSMQGLAQQSPQQSLQRSPITPGFWAWPREKPAGPEQVAAECRSKFAVQFEDGRYFGLRLRSSERPAGPPAVDEVGRCQFNRETQVERCELRAPQSDGSVITGAIESRFSTEPDGSIRMRVTPRGAQGPDASKSSEPFDVFPVRCPDDLVWSALNGAEPPK